MDTYLQRVKELGLKDMDREVLEEVIKKLPLRAENESENMLLLSQLVQLAARIKILEIKAQGYDKLKENNLSLENLINELRDNYIAYSQGRMPHDPNFAVAGEQGSGEKAEE